MKLSERVKLYSQKFPNYPKLIYNKNFILGTWMIGNYYKNKTNYYGAYPHSYLERIMSLFPDKKQVLHLFSGSLSSLDFPESYLLFDINKKVNPNVVGNAENLSNYFAKNSFNLILADPPYSSEDAEHYGTPLVNRNKVVKECVRVLKRNGFLIWLDQVFPMYRKMELKLVGTIGLIRSTNHRVRMVFIYKRI